MSPIFLDNQEGYSSDISFISTLYETFIKGQPAIDINLLQWPEFELKGIRIIEISNTSYDPRNSKKIEVEKWKIAKELFHDMYSINSENNGKWDMSLDGKYLYHRYSLNTHLLYRVEKLNYLELKLLKEPQMNEDEDRRKRDVLRPILVERLIKKGLTLGELFSYKLEKEYGVHFKLIQRGEHRHMRYKPRSGNVTWVSNQVLGWGDNRPGWDITTDVKIACCRLEYDEYYNFIVQLLNQEQIQYYSKKSK